MEKSSTGSGPGGSGIPTRVALGPMRRDLVATYARWFNDLETLRTLNVTPRPMTNEQELAWFEGQVNSGDALRLTVYERRTGRPIGTTTLASIDRRDGTANFAAVIGEAGLRGRGYGTEAIKLTLRHAFAELGLRDVMVRIVAFNEASRRAHEKVGFREFGRRRRCRLVGGRWWDEIHMVCTSAGFEGLVPAADKERRRA